MSGMVTCNKGLVGIPTKSTYTFMNPENVKKNISISLNKKKYFLQLHLIFLT